MTSQEGFEKQIEIYRSMTGQQRMQIGFELYDLARDMVRCSVHHQHPDWEEQRIEQEVIRRFRLAERIP